MSETVFDRLIGDFHFISGMDLSLTDSDFHGIVTRRCPYENFCSYFHRSKNGVALCKASDAERMAEAKDQEEPILYVCPAGITEAIIPVMKNDLPIAYLFAAMGINKDRISDGEILAQALRAAPELDPQETASHIGRMKHMSERELEAYYRMLLILAKHIENEDLLLPPRESIGNLVKQYVKNNLAAKLTLTNMALSLHCSTVTLTEHFKAEFGMTIMEYVTGKRMERAEFLLLSTDAPLREIASTVGFSDVEYFSRTFRRFHGLPPAAWRTKNKS